MLNLPKPFGQVDIDQLDQNKAVNKAGGILGKFNPVADAVSTDSLQPYSEASSPLLVCLIIVKSQRMSSWFVESQI